MAVLQWLRMQVLGMEVSGSMKVFLNIFYTPFHHVVTALLEYLVSTFCRFAMVPTLVENSKIFVYLFVNIFVNNIMTGQPMHTASKERIALRTPAISIII